MAYPYHRTGGVARKYGVKSTPPHQQANDKCDDGDDNQHVDPVRAPIWLHPEDAHSTPSMSVSASFFSGHTRGLNGRSVVILVQPQCGHLVMRQVGLP